MNKAMKVDEGASVRKFFIKGYTFIITFKWNLYVVMNYLASKIFFGKIKEK